MTEDPEVFLATDQFKYLLLNFYHFYIWQSQCPEDPYDYGYHQLVHKLGPQVLEELQNGHPSIVVDASYENSAYPIVHGLHHLFIRLGIRLDRITVMFPTTHGARLARTKFPNSEMKFCSVNTFELEAFQQLTWNRKRRFLMLNNRYSADRAWMFFKSWQAGILKNAYATFGVTRFNHLFTDGNPFVAQMKENISEEVGTVYGDNALAEFIKFADETRFPYLSELNLTDQKALNPNYSEFLLSHHNATHIAMIQESYESPKLGLANSGYDGLYFPTEKTFRTIGMRQPFLVYSAQHCLKYLREQGYRTFGPYIDESYDAIFDDQQRHQAVFNELNRLDKMAEHEFNPLMEQLSEIADFNYQHFMGRRNHVLHNTHFEDQVLANHFQIPVNSG